jgi:ATP-dependent exoDNAse (exonuclease V) alpha subunit
MYDEVVSNYEQQIKFVVGFAGSGKSTRLVEMAHADSLVLTPTHKAADVLAQKGIKAITIHSALKLVPTINKEFRKGEKMQRLNRVGGVNMDSIKDVFIDEFSMISSSILDLLLNVLPAHCKVTVFGDPYQLPPVDGEPIDPLMYTDDIEELTVQHRAEAPEVVETFMRFMNYIKTGKEMNLKMNPAIKYGSLEDFNPETDRILAYTNQKVIELNNKVADIMELEEDISHGESCLINGIDAVFLAYQEEAYQFTIYPTCIRKGALMEGSDLHEKAMDTAANIDKYNVNMSGYDTAYVATEEGIYEIYYDVDHYANSKRLKADVERYQTLLVEEHKIPKSIKLADWCRQNQGAKYVRERGRAWSEFLSHQNYVFNLRRPFATTVHKSQGSEFDTVYIAQRDIKQSIKQNYYEQYARLMYVALSRAKKKVVIV